VGFSEHLEASDFRRSLLRFRANLGGAFCEFRKPRSELSFQQDGILNFFCQNIGAESLDFVEQLVRKSSGIYCPSVKSFAQFRGRSHCDGRVGVGRSRQKMRRSRREWLLAPYIVSLLLIAPTVCEGLLVGASNTAPPPLTPSFIKQVDDWVSTISHLFHAFIAFPSNICMDMVSFHSL
jgi:hypothetical protein